MKVDFTGVVTSFDGIPPGDFFMFDLRSGGAFGLCVAIADNKKAALSLPSANSKDRAWIQVGGLTHQTFIHFPDAVLRLKLSSFTAVVTGAGLICVGTQRFIRGYEQQGFQYSTFNVESGAMDQIAEHEGVQFSQWSAGIIIDGKFEELYSFPSIRSGP